MSLTAPTPVGGVVGPQIGFDGTNMSFRQGKAGEQISGELHGRYYEGNYRKARFGGSMQAVLATATIAGLSTSITGVSVLANPVGSGVNLVIERVGVGFVVAAAAALAFGIATGQSTTALSGTLTSLSPKSKNIGSGTLPVGLLYASAAITLPVAPTVDTVLGYMGTGVATAIPTPSTYELAGSIVLPAGGYAVFWTSAVLAASAHIMSWEWEEVLV